MGSRGKSLTWPEIKSARILPGSLLRQIGLSSSLIISCHSMNFASLSCKAHAGSGAGEEPVDTLARPQLFPSVPRAPTLELISASRGLDVLWGIHVLTSIQAWTSFLCLFRSCYFCFEGCLVGAFLCFGWSFFFFFPLVGSFFFFWFFFVFNSHPQ